MIGPANSTIAANPPDFLLGLDFLLLAVVVICAILYIMNVLDPKANKPIKKRSNVIPFRRPSLRLCARHVSTVRRARFALVVNESECDVCRRLNKETP